MKGQEKYLWWGLGAVALWLLLKPSTTAYPAGSAFAANNGGFLGAATNAVTKTSALLTSLFGTASSPPSTQTPAPTDENLNSYASSSGFASVPNVSTGDGFVTDASDDS